MSYDENSPRYTRSQARSKSQTMDDGIEPGNSISQISKERSHVSVTSRATHSTSSHGLDRSKRATGSRHKYTGNQDELTREKTQLKRNKLELENDLEKRKLEVDLDMEKTDLKEQMDIAKAEREMLDHGSSSSGLAVHGNQPSNAEINKMLDECYTFLAAGKVDGTKACRVYCPSTTKQKATRETQEKPRCTNVPASDKNTQSVKDRIGYFPLPARNTRSKPRQGFGSLISSASSYDGSFTGPKDRAFRL